MMITPRMKNYITGIMSVTVGIINVVLFIRMLLPNLQQNIFFLRLWFFVFIPGIIGLLPIPLSRFDKPLETRAFINILCFFVSSLPLVYTGLFFLRLTIAFPFLALSVFVLIIAQESKILSKKGLLLITLVTMASIIVPYFLLSPTRQPSADAYEKTIIRNTSNVEEANALTIAENINYSDIFDLQRFTTNDHDENIYYDETYLYYTWAHFIDTKAIEYYDHRFENLKVGPRSVKKPISIKFHYKANVSTWDQIRVVYVPYTIQILSPNGSVCSTFSTGEMLFAYRNNSKYQSITAEEINFSLSKSYVIEMKLEYEETWGPLAAFNSDVHQIIIVDENFEPFLLGVRSYGSIS